MSDAAHVYSLRTDRVYSSSSEKYLLLVKLDQIVMQMTHRRMHEGQDICQGRLNSVRAAKKKETSGNHRAKTTDDITSNQLSTHPYLREVLRVMYFWLTYNLLSDNKG